MLVLLEERRLERPLLLGRPRPAARLDAITSGTAEVARSMTLDLRTYGVGAQILRDLGVRRMRLLAKPRKMPSMAGFGLQVTGYLED